MVRNREKKPKVGPEGGELVVENKTLEEAPIVLTHAQAKQLLKKANPPKPRSEKQIAHAKKMGELLKERNLKLKEERDAQKKAEEEKKPKARIIVLPKRARTSSQPSTSTKKKPVTTIAEEDDEEDLPRRGRGQASRWEDDEEEEEEQEEEVKPVKKASKKAMELVDTVNKLDQKINQLKVSNRYDKLLRF